MATKSYKCPSCGAGIHFKPTLDKFKCDYCLSEYTVEEFKEASEELIAEEKQEETVSESTEEIIPENLQQYTCKSCGAEVVTDETTSSTFCFYCHNPVILTKKLQGDFKPKKMIPFTVDKEKAKESFLKWAGDKKLVPEDFTSSSQLEKITGVYLPYWWVDAKAEINFVGEGRKVRVYRVGDIEHTETKKYKIVRKGKMDINNIPEFAFTKIKKALINGILPYRDSEAIDFSMPYLSGFFAEQYDIPKEKVQPKIDGEINKYFSNMVNGTVSEFNHVSSRKNAFKSRGNDWNYTLLPAWILTYNYNGKIYVYAVNGQTGKAYGELPLSTSRTTKASGIIFGIVFVLLILGGMFIW